MHRGILTEPDSSVVELMGVRFTPWTEGAVVRHVLESLRAGGSGGWIVTPNVDIVRKLFKDDTSRSAVRDATFALADGMPIVWASLLQGTPLPERVAGSSLFDTLCAAAAEERRSVYLLGGEAGVADEATAHLRGLYPDLVVSGWSPPHGLEATAEGIAEIRERVRASGADIVFCGFGFPKQEQVIATLVDTFPAVWFVGCGASLTFAAGRISRAPVWMQRSGLEWAHRLAHEPARLGRRYIVEDLPFAVRMMAASAGRRLATAPSTARHAPTPQRLPLAADRADTTPARVVFTLDSVPAPLPVVHRSPASRVSSVPSVGVVIPTHNRPQLMRRALESVLAQDYPGAIHVVVVFDRCPVEDDLVRHGDHRVSVVANTRRPGLAGARNTGIGELETDLVAFCDDDDIWLPGKLAAQVARLDAVPGAGFSTTATRIDYGPRSIVRRADRSQVSVADLSRSRMSMLHSSSFVFRREAMLGPSGFGLVEEALSGSMAEDWDLLLRAARHHPIEHVDEPLTAVQWGESSYFNDAWADRNDAHAWLLAHHPEMAQDPQARGLMLSKLAFGSAALGSRADAVRFARQALGANWREPRTPLAMLAVAGVPPKWMLTQLNKRGHGI